MPTTAPQPAPPPPQATALPSTQAKPPAAAPLAPSAGDPAAAAAAILPSAPIPSRPTLPASGPSPVTRVRGIERKGLTVEAAALRLRHPQATDAAIDEAVTVLGGVVPHTCTVLTLENLGRSSQEGVARLVDRLLLLVDQQASRGAGRHIERLLELLGELAETLQPASGLNWRRKPLRRALAEVRPELDTLRIVLEVSEATLRDQQARVAALQHEQQQVLDGLNARLIAIGELRAAFDDARRLSALDDREAALNKSVALLLGHELQMRRLDADLSQLAERIRDAVLHALPAWLAMAAAAPAETLHDTDRFTLRDALHRVMLSLRPAP